MKTVLDHYAETLPPAHSAALAAVRAFAAWRVGRQDGAFIPTANDDVDLRNYFLHLRINRTDPQQLAQIARALHDFCTWEAESELIGENPFTEFDLSQPLLTREQLQRRRENLPADPLERELARLRARNRLARRLNDAADMQTAIDAALHRYMARITTPPHDFAVAQAINLPPGLEMDERRYLCQPGDCHCQWLLRHGRLQRAVNVVECTRLQDAARARGENRELRFLRPARPAHQPADLCRRRARSAAAVVHRWGDGFAERSRGRVRPAAAAGTAGRRAGGFRRLPGPFLRRSVPLPRRKPGNQSRNAFSTASQNRLRRTSPRFCQPRGSQSTPLRSSPA